MNKPTPPGRQNKPLSQPALSSNRAPANTAHKVESELRERIRMLESDLRNEQLQNKQNLQTQMREQDTLKRQVTDFEQSQLEMKGSLTMARWISGLFFVGLCGASVFSYGKIQSEQRPV